MRGNEWTGHTPVRIVFGPGCLKNLPELVRGRRALVVTTPGAGRRGLTDRVLELLRPGRSLLCERVKPNPSPAEIEDLARECAASAVDIEVIVGIGGGSALDTAKALSARLSRPIIAVPTTAGSGSEVTPFVALWDRAEGRKLSLHSSELLPEAALLDPELTLTLGWEQTLSSGLDALSHALESVWNRRANPRTLRFAFRSAELVLSSLKALRADPGSLPRRAMMMEASLLSGLAISQTQTALAHSISYPLTARRGVPHGLACSFSLPAVLLFNEPADDGRLRRLADALEYPSVRALADALAGLLRELEVGPRLLEHLGTRAELLALVPGMLSPERAGNSLREADQACIEEIVGQASELLHFPA
ncbi:MAG TPA: phosphonoacetaldehyde reductase [Bdellovibrionota bacterium]|nr:phosphonoacetaldehyde reductase [Bdellovibrionota bacterium]